MPVPAYKELSSRNLQISIPFSRIYFNLLISFRFMIIPLILLFRILNLPLTTQLGPRVANGQQVPSYANLECVICKKQNFEPLLVLSEKPRESECTSFSSLALSGLSQISL